MKRNRIRQGRRARRLFPDVSCARATLDQRLWDELVIVAREYLTLKEATEPDEHAVRSARAILRGAARMMHNHEQFYGYKERSVEDIEKRALRDVLLMRKYPERYEGVGEE